MSDIVEDQGPDWHALVRNALESKGVLAQIRAELRAAVYTVVDEQEKLLEVYVPNPKALKIAESPAAKLAMQLIVDVLDFFHLDKTISVLAEEAHLASHEQLDPSALRERTTAVLRSIPPEGPRWGGDEPVLVQLLASANPLGETAPGTTRPSYGDGNTREVTAHQWASDRPGGSPAGSFRGAHSKPERWKNAGSGRMSSEEEDSGSEGGDSDEGSPGARRPSTQRGRLEDFSLTANRTGTFDFGGTGRMGETAMLRGQGRMDSGDLDEGRGGAGADFDDDEASGSQSPKAPLPQSRRSSSNGEDLSQGESSGDSQNLTGGLPPMGQEGRSPHQARGRQQHELQREDSQEDADAPAFDSYDNDFDDIPAGSGLFSQSGGVRLGASGSAYVSNQMGDTSFSPRVAAPAPMPPPAPGPPPGPVPLEARRRRASDQWDLAKRSPESSLDISELDVSADNLNMLDEEFDFVEDVIPPVLE